MLFLFLHSHKTQTQIGGIKKKFVKKQQQQQKKEFFIQQFEKLLRDCNNNIEKEYLALKGSVHR